jgi:hypothetical protein
MAVVPGCKVVTLFSTRLIPHLSRMTSESEGWRPVRQKLKPQVSAPFSASGAGHSLGRDHALKVETRVRTPSGLGAQGPGQGTRREAVGELNRDSNAEYPENRRVTFHQYKGTEWRRTVAASNGEKSRSPGRRRGPPSKLDRTLENVDALLDAYRNDDGLISRLPTTDAPDRR